MSEKSKKATTLFTIKKASVNGKEKEFTDKILNNDIGKEYIIIIAPQNYQHGEGWFSGKGKGAVKETWNWLKNDAGVNGKFMFVHQGLRRVRLNKEFGFSWTILMYTSGYTEMQLCETKEAFKNFAPNSNFVRIKNYQEAINYINTKSISKTIDDKKVREKNSVERIFIYCHGFVGKLAMGLTNRHSGDEDLDWDEKVVAKLKQNAFSKTAKIYSFSCKTGLGNLEIEKHNNINKKVVNTSVSIGASPTTGIPSSNETYKTVTLPLLGEKSLAQKFSNITGAMTYAYCSRSEYSDTLNTADELDFMAYYEAGSGKKLDRKNDSYKYLLKRENRKKEDIRRFDELQKIQNKRFTVDNGKFDPEGARYPVRGGDTPVGVPNDMKTYKKN